MDTLLLKCERWLDSGSWNDIVTAVDRFVSTAQSGGQQADASMVAELQLRKAMALVQMAREEKEKGSAAPLQIEAWQTEAVNILTGRQNLISGDTYWEQMLAETAMESGNTAEALAAYRQLQTLEPGNGDWSAGTAACLEQLALPPSGESFRARTDRMWKRFLDSRQSLEEQARSSWSGKPLPPEISTAVPDMKITLRKDGRRCEAVVSPGDGPGLSLLGREMLRRAPEQLKTTWDFADSDSRGSSALTPAGWSRIDLDDVHVQFEKTPLGTMQFTLFLRDTVEESPWEKGTMIFRRDETSTREVLEQCLKHRLGSLFCQRYAESCRAALSMPGDTPTLTDLPDLLEEAGYPVPLPLNMFADRLDAYEMTGDPEKMTWRTGVTRGWTVYPELLRDLCSGSCRTLDSLRRHGAWAGSVCIPLASLPAGGELAEALLGDLILELEEHLSSDIWHCCGYGIGETEEYLDFLAWDTPAFLSAVRICLQDAGIPGICVHSMSAESAPVPMEDWPRWNPPEGETLEVSPVRPAASLPEDAWRRPGYPVCSRSAPPEPEKREEVPEGEQFEDLERKVLNEDCGKYNSTVDTCVSLLAAGDYDGVVSAVRASDVANGTGNEDAKYVLKNLEAMALYRKGKTLMHSRGELTSEAAACLRGAYFTADMNRQGARSGVMNRIIYDCLQLLDGIYFLTDRMDGESIDPETVRWLTQAGQRAAVPLFPIPFRQRVADTWEVFQAREAEFRKALDEAPGRNPQDMPEICGRVMDVFNCTFCCQTVCVSRTPEGRYRVNFLTDGEYSLVLALGELIRRAPESLKEHWDFTAGQPEPGRSAPAGDTMLDAEDVYVQADKTSEGWKFSMSVPSMTFSSWDWDWEGEYKCSQRELRGAATFLLKMTLGELWIARNRCSAYLVAKTRMDPRIGLLTLPARMNRKNAGVPMSLDSFLNTFEMHTYIQSSTVGCSWRCDDVISRTCCPYYLESLYNGYFNGLEWLTFAGAVPGSICLPRTDSRTLYQGDSLSLAMEEDLPKRISPDIWKYLGWGCSSEMLYLDFLAWDLAPFLDAVEEYLGPERASKAVFHVWHRSSPAVPLKDWRSWKFPEWQQGFPV